MNLSPINQTKLFGLNDTLIEMNSLFLNNKLPNKILLSGQKGIGKSTLAYHLINYILSNDEKFAYDKMNFAINEDNKYFKLTQNGSNPNFILIDIAADKKKIEITQIRNMIVELNKSSFNDKPRFVLIDNIEHLNINSANSLLKTLEEPNKNIFFILINNRRKVLSTIKSRCLDFKISLTYEESISVINNIVGENIFNLVNKEFLCYYFTPGNIYNLLKFSKTENIDLKDMSLKSFLKIIIKKNFSKIDGSIKDLIYELIELSLHEKSLNNNHYYNYFLKRIDDIKRYNLDEESFFIEYESKILNA